MRFSLINWISLLFGMASVEAAHAQSSCSATTAVAISCLDFQGKLNRTVNVNDTGCYKIIEESCRLTLNSIPVPRNHTYGAVFFNQLEFAPIDRDWVGNLEISKAFGQKLAVNNIRFSNAFLIASGRVNNFSSERTFLKTFTLQPAFSIVNPEDKALYDLRKSFGSKSLQGTSMPNSYFDVGVAGSFLLKSVNLSGSRLNGNADLSAMTFNNVKLNNVTLLGDSTSFKAPKLIRSDNQAVPASKDQFLALTRKTWQQADLELFRTASSLDLSNLNLADKSLRSLDFRKSNISNSDFTGSDLRGSDFRGTIGFASPSLVLRDANLAGAKFCLSDIKSISTKIAVNEIDSRLNLLEVETGATGNECPSPGTSELKMISDIRNALLSTSTSAESLANAAGKIWSKGLVSKILFGDSTYGKLTPTELAKNPQVLQILVNGWKLPVTGETRSQLMDNLCVQWDLRAAQSADQQNLFMEILPYYGIGTLSMVDLLRFTKNMPINAEEAKASLATWESALAYQGSCAQRPKVISAALFLRQAYLKDFAALAANKSTLPLLSYFAKAPSTTRLSLQRELQADIKIQAAILDSLALQLSRSVTTSVSEADLAAQTNSLNQTWNVWGGAARDQWNALVASLSDFAEPVQIKNASRTFNNQVVSGGLENPYENASSGDTTNNFNGASAILAVQSQIKSLSTADDLARRHKQVLALSTLVSRFEGPEAFLESLADRLGLLSPYYAAHKLNILSEVSFGRAEPIPVLAVTGLFLQDELIQQHMLQPASGTTAVRNLWSAWLQEVQTAIANNQDFAQYRQQTIDAGSFSEFIMLLEWWRSIDQTESFVANQLLARNGKILIRPYLVPSSDLSYTYSHQFAWGSYTFVAAGPSDASGIRHPLLLNEEKNADPYILGSRLLSRTRAALLLPLLNRDVELSKEYVSLVTGSTTPWYALKFALLNSWSVPFESLTSNTALNSTFEGLGTVLAPYAGKTQTTDFPASRLDQDLSALNSRFSGVERDTIIPAGTSDVGNFRNVFKNSLDAYASMLFY